MSTQDTLGIKEKIISILRIRGPSLPVHIAREINLSMLFSSAFLSELFSEKKIKISNMKVGNSPLYFLVGQEPSLEKFSPHLKSKEKEAFILLKEEKFLRDKEQDPAIRVALREIKDFAIPFKKNEEIIWRYLTIPEEEFNLKKRSPDDKSKPVLQHEVSTIPQRLDVREAQEKPLDIFAKEETKEIKKPQKQTIKKIAKKATRKKTTPKVNEKFFNKVKEHLVNNQIEISDIIGFSKNDIILKILEKDKEKLLVAYNKKSLKEEDLLKAHKKAEELNLPYILLNLGKPLKKLNNLIQAIRNLDKIEKIKENN